jgi:hypothetical protein
MKNDIPEFSKWSCNVDTQVCDIDVYCDPTKTYLSSTIMIDNNGTTATASQQQQQQHQHQHQQQRSIYDNSVCYSNKSGYVTPSPCNNNVITT